MYFNRLLCVANESSSHKFNDASYVRTALWSETLVIAGQELHKTQTLLAQIGDSVLRTIYLAKHFPNTTS